MTTKYYSDFFPAATTPGKKGSTVPIISSATLALINQELTQAGLDSEAALAKLAVIIDDGFLSQNEKPDVILEVNTIVAEKPGLDNQADTFSVSRTAYDSAYSALATYLTNLSPPYNQLTSDTPIVSADFNAAFVNYYNEKTNLISAIASKAATLATWAGVSGLGKPSDNATADVVLVTTFGTATVQGNKVTKTGASGAWDTAVSSKDSFTGASSMSFCLTSLDIIAGLSASKGTANNYYNTFVASIERSGSNVYVIEAGVSTNVGSTPGGVTISANTVFTIQYNGLSLRYYADGTLFRTISATAGMTLYAAINAYYQNSMISNIRFLPGDNNEWAAVGGAGRPSDNATSDTKFTVIGTAVTDISGNRLRNTGAGSDYNACVVTQARYGAVIASMDIVSGSAPIILALATNATSTSVAQNATLIFSQSTVTWSLYTNTGSLFTSSSVGGTVTGKAELACDRVNLYVVIGGILRAYYPIINVASFQALGIDSNPIYAKFWAYNSGVDYTGLSFSSYTSNKWGDIGGDGKPDNNATTGDNILPNSQWLTDYQYWYGGTRTAGSSGDPVTYYAAVPAGGKISTLGTTTRPLPSAKKLYLGAWVYNNSTGGQFQFSLYGYTATDGYVQQYYANFFPTAGWSYQEFAFEPASSVAKYYVDLASVGGGRIGAPRLSASAAGASAGAIAGTDLRDSTGAVLNDNQIITSQGTSLDTQKVAGVLSATLTSTANAAKAFADDVADNSKFSSDEKKRYVTWINSLDSDVPAEVAQANALGLTTVASNLSSAYSTFKAYLASVNYTSTGSSTSINRSTFQAQTKAFTDALTAVVTALDAKAATTANWTGVANDGGKPADNAGTTLTMRYIVGRSIVQGNKYTRSSGNTPGYGDSAISSESFKGTAYFSGKLDTSGTFLGLTQFPDPITVNNVYANHYVVMDFGAHWSTDGNFYAFYNSSYTYLGTYYNGVSLNANTRWSGYYDGTVARIFADGVQMWSQSRTTGLTMRLFTTAYNTGCSVSEMQFGPFTDQSIAVVGQNLTIPGSGQKIGDQRNLIPINAMNLGYKYTGTVSYTAAAGSPATATISLTSGYILLGDVSIPYNGGSVGVTGSSGYSTYFYLYSNDPTFAGGSPTVYASSNGDDIYASNGRVWFGAVQILFPSSGSGSGSGGAGGGGGVRCISADNFLHDGSMAADITPGFNLLTLDYENMDTTTYSVIRKINKANRDCVRIKTERNFELDLSTEADLTLYDTSIINVCNSLGLKIATLDKRWWRFECIFGPRFRWEKIVSIEKLGMRPVIQIDAGGATYAGGRDPRKLVFSHNKADNPIP